MPCNSDADAGGAAALPVAGWADSVNSGPSWRVRSQRRVVDFDRVAGVQQLRMRQRVARPRERLRGDVGVLGEDHLPLVPRPFADSIEQDRAQGSRVVWVSDVRRGAERFLLQHVLELESTEERPEQAGRVLTELQPDTVAGARHRVDEHRHVGHAQALGPHRVPIAIRSNTLRARQQAGLDPLPSDRCAPAPGAQRRCLPTRASRRRAWPPEPRERPDVRRRTAPRTRALVRPPTTPNRRNPATSLSGWSRPNPVTSQCTSREFAAHMVGAVDAEPVGRRRLERSDHHVGVGGQLSHPVTSGGRRQIEAHAALAPRPHRECGGLAEPTPVRRLDHQHVGAVVGEHHARHRGADALADLDDPQPGAERAVGSSGAPVVPGHAGA